MQDITYITTEGGEPLVRLTLNTPEVNSIFSALMRAADDHTKRVQEFIEQAKHTLPDWRGMAAQAESHRNVGRWEAISDALDTPFWDWVNGENVLCEVCDGGED